jgi:hypothetical protein
MRWLPVLTAFLFAGVLRSGAQEAVIAPPDNLVVEGAPKIPGSLAETAGRYGSYRFAGLADWHPAHREMLISTRFGDTPQLHLVKMPGGERQQRTFYPETLANARFHPNGGDYIVFMKDIGGGEWFQLYRYDVDNGQVTLLTDGESRNLMGPKAFPPRPTLAQRTESTLSISSRRPEPQKFSHLSLTLRACRRSMRILD